MTLEADVGVHVGELDLRVELVADDGETVAVLGPNGAGKTTFLQALAGLRALDRGRVVLDGTTLDDPGTATFVPTERRSLGVVFQDYALFPHLSVLENVAFGPRARGVPRRVARARAGELLDRLGLAELGGRRPTTLSGGQAQRVALARALATEPRLLLLDEPLTALDASAHSDLRRELRRTLGGFAGVRILVTHDPLDAAALADRIVVIEQGSVVQQGHLADVTARPRSRYVADLVGTNLLRGTGRGDHVELPGHARLIAAGPSTGPVLAVVHPHAVVLHRRVPEGSARNTWPGRVESVERLGDRARVRIGGAVPLVAEVTAGALAELHLAPGSEIWSTVKATEVAVYPA